MRVTQSMLSNNMLRNLSNSYQKMGKLQEQLVTGQKVNRPSDDPVVVMKGMGYRMQVDKVHQFQRNIGEVHNWLDNTDDALDKVGSALHRVSELVVNGSTDTMTTEDREKLQGELAQLREQVRDLSNTKVGNRYLFSGTNTSTPLFDKARGTFTKLDEAPGLQDKVTIDVFDGISLDVNTTGAVFQDIDEMFEQLLTEIDGAQFERSIGQVQAQLDQVLTIRADVGARQNRAEMMTERLASLEITATKQMSNNEDVDYERVITEMITEESIHRAALAVGARIIQPSLVDFLR